jgi:hypothetical protein
MSERFHETASRFSKYREVGGVRVECAFYGEGTDWLCRLSDLHGKPKAKDFTDGYRPARELGFLWLREDFNRWVITGMLDYRLASSREELDALLDFVALAAAKEEVWWVCNVELVKVSRHRVFNGEQDDGFRKVPSNPPLTKRRT